MRLATPPMWKVRSVSCVPGLADRLRGDDADGLAEVHRAPGRQVAAVALARTRRGARRR